MTAAEMIMIQINTMQDAINVMQAAIDDLTSSINPDDATWADVSRYAHLVDGIRRAGIDN